MDVIDANENPLQLYNFPSTQQCKNSGRPRRNQKTIFSPPPRSIVSLLLRKTTYDETIKTNSRNKLVSNTNEDTKSERKDKEWVCRQCSFRTANKDLLKVHKATHKNKLHQCDFTNCKYSTKSSSNLIKHRRTHTAEKPYICDKCLFRTNFQNSLTVHKRIHTSEKPYTCQYCEYRCNSSSNLKKHCSHRHKKLAKCESDSRTEGSVQTCRYISKSSPITTIES